MELVVLGSGTSAPHPKRSSPAYWLQTSEGRALLDCSPDAAHRMAQENLDWPDLDAIWISHFHLDHVGGLPSFLFGLKWAPQTLSRVKPLTVFGPAGLRDLISAFDKANNYRLLSQRFPLEIVEVKPGIQFGFLPDLQARVLSTPHTRESLALRLLEESGKSFVYTSDTGFSEELIEFARGVDLLLMESSFRRNKPVQEHLELAEAMQIVSASDPRQVVLTHLYPEWDDFDLVGDAMLRWPGKMLEATDGLRLTI